MRESLKTGNKEDVLMMKTNTVKQVKELTTPLQPGFLEPNTAADIVYAASADVTAVCQNYGQVIATGSPDPSKCHITVKSVAAADEKSTAILQAVNLEGKPCEEPIKSLECKLTSELTGTEACCSVERRGQSQYEISFKPTVKGRHQLHVTLADSGPVRGSPFSIAVKSPVEKLGKPILTLGGMEKPWGIAINQKGEVVVTECGSMHCVSVFSPSGEKLQSFGSLGSDPVKFCCPTSVAVDGEGNILVTDTNNYRIQKFTAGGQFLTAVGTRGSGPLQFELPYGIAYSAGSNKVYVADTCNHRIQVLNSDLSFSSTFGSPGSGNGEFRHPHAIACDHTGNVYVADTGNHRIEIFTAEGKFLRMFGRHGQGRGELDLLVGVAVDASGMVYVSERGNARVSVFTSEGRFVMLFGRKGKGPGEVDDPVGLAVDTNGVVYLCDKHNHRVQIF